MLAVLLLWILPLGLVLALGLQPARDAAAEKWAAAHGVSPLLERVELVRRSLTRARRWRFGAAFAALVGSAVLRPAGSHPPEWVNGLVVGSVGYLVGAVIAEVTRPRIGPSSPSALLAPRTLATYLPRVGLMALAALPAVTAALVPVSSQHRPGPRFGLAGTASLVGAAATSAVLAGTVWLAMRSVVGRPQPAASAELVAIDDAMRGSSLHALNGAAVALQLFLLAFVLGQVQGAFAATGVFPRLQFLASLIALSCLPLALGSWALLGHPSSWRSRRTFTASGR